MSLLCIILCLLYNQFWSPIGKAKKWCDFLWLYFQIKLNKLKGGSDARRVMVCEIPLVSPLEVSTISTAITQENSPCPMYKHVWGICTLKHLKVDKWEWTGEERKEKSWDKPVMQSYNQKLKLELSLERRGIRLWLAFPSAKRSKKTEWASQ